MSHPLLRTLISEMVETYLEESYENDIVESIFEEVSEETWEAIEEAILNELSPSTLDNYIKKANISRNKNVKIRDTNREKEAEAKANSDMWYNKSINAKHKNRRSTNDKVYPWDTQDGAFARANSEGKKEYMYAQKAKHADKKISRRDQGISRATNKLGQ